MIGGQPWQRRRLPLYDKLTGRGAQITYDFENFRVNVPSGTGNGISHATWEVSGTLRIRTKNPE